MDSLLQIVLYVGTSIIWFGFLKNLFQKNFGLDIIAGVALVSTIVAKQYLAGVVVLVMFWGGQFLEEYAMRRAKKELALLLSKNPTKAHLKVGESFEEVELGKIKPGDLVLVKPQEVVSVDGVVITGETSINEAVLSGESDTLLKKSGSLVFAGTENLSNPVVIKVLKFSHETKFNEIVELVKNSQNNKARIVRLADKYSIYFTVLTFVVAIVTWFLTHDFVRVISVLVVATPCPLLIATPVAIMSGMSASYKRGVIVKTGVALEILSRVKNFVFDKTGTITLGSSQVVDVVTFENNDNGKSEDEILTLASSLEQYSTHVLAKAVLKYFEEEKQNKKNLSLYLVENFQEDFGAGVSGLINGQEYLFGKKEFLERKGIVFEKENENSQTIVFLSLGKKLVGAVVFSEIIRPETKEVFERFKHEKKVEISILTGDNKQKAFQIAKYLSVEKVIAESTPAEKLEHVKKLQAVGLVAMVGDGVNDAPALSQADIGIAIAPDGKTVSSDVSDIVVLSNSLRAVYDVFHISQMTVKLARQGILFGMGASFMAMFFSGLGYIQPLNGAFLQEIIDVLVILNALRLSKTL